MLCLFFQNGRQNCRRGVSQLRPRGQELETAGRKGAPRRLYENCLLCVFKVNISSWELTIVSSTLLLAGWDFLHHPKSNAKRIRNMSLDQVSRELNKTQTRVKKRNLHLDTELGRIRAAATSSYPASPTNNSSFQPESHSVRYREPVVLAQTHSYDARAGSKKQVGSRAWLKQHPVAMTQLSVATTKPEKLFIPAVPGPGYMAGSSSQPFSSTRSQYRPSKPMPRHSAYYPRVRSPSASELLHMTTATSNSPLARGRSPSPTYHLSPLAPLTPELRGVEESKIESGGGRGATPLGGLTQRTVTPTFLSLSVTKKLMMFRFP